MLHELLIALSGHPSPLFHGQSHAQDQDFLLSPSEKALLRSVGQLAHIHAQLKDRLDFINSKHASMICRATAASIRQTHLRRFQRKILEVESKVLTKDASLVGAYAIVPLASIVNEFDTWQRLMAWYWEVACFMSDTPSSQDCQTSRSGTSLIDHLRNEMQTGYPEVEQAATELSKVAEAAWLGQVSSWLVYGSIPVLGAHDFFIQARTESDTRTYVKEKSLLPACVTAATASAILFVGNSICQVRSRGNDAQLGREQGIAQWYESEMAASHLQKLSSLSLPMTSSRFSRTIAEIKLSLSQNVLQYLLPMKTIQQLLSCLRQFFLLSRGDFAIALIETAEHRLQTRQQDLGHLLSNDPAKAMQSLSLRDGELHQVLQQVWRALALKDNKSIDDDLEFAREHIQLAFPRPSSRPSTSDSIKASFPGISPIEFKDLLLPAVTELRLDIPPPMDLFLSKNDIEKYSSINAYLLAIRRAHMKLSDLWRRTTIRRDRSEVPASSQRHNQARAVAMRKVWATCSAAVFLLAETTAFFEGEIILGSCDTFIRWVESSAEQYDHSGVLDSTDIFDRPAARDPETLASGHRAFMNALAYSILLTDIVYTRELRELLGNVDNLTASFDRLLNVRRKIDVEQQANLGHEDLELGNSAYLIEEEQRISLELDRARKKVDSSLRAVVNRLRALNQERIGSLRYVGLETAATGGFEIWRDGGGVDRLLMKLDFGGMATNSVP